MKKFVCLLMAVMLVMSFAAYAVVQYEVCPECHGRMTEETTEKKIDTDTCPKTGDPTMQDPVYRVTTTLSCTSCDYSESDSYEYIACRH